jgi:CHASE2 domain-containing sensor protein
MIRDRISTLPSLALKAVRRLLGGVGSVRQRIDRHALILSLVALAAFTFFDLMDSFGFDSTLDKSVSQAAATLYGPFYGRDSNRDGQSQIVLALIDEDSLAELKADGFPLPYRSQLEIVQSIAQHEPQAIFVDMSYLTPRNADVEQYSAAMFSGQQATPPADVIALADGLKAIRDGGIPVYIGPVSQDFLLSPLAELAQVSVQLPVAASYEHVDSYFGVASPDPFEPAALLPAAVALYLQICRSQGTGCQEIQEHLRDRQFFLQWGLGSSERQLRRTPASLRKRCATESSPTVQVGLLFWRGLMRRSQSYSEAAVADRCFYHDAMPVWAIMAGNDVNGPMAELIKGKIVMIGGSTQASGDRWPVPFYTDTPGVAIHAMALDNLIEAGGKVPLVPDRLLGVDTQDLLQIVTILAALITFYALARNQSLRLTATGPDGETRLRRVAVGMVVCVAVAACLFIYIVARLAAWPLPFVIVNILAPGGIIAIGLMQFGRLARPRPPAPPAPGDNP